MRGLLFGLSVVLVLAVMVLVPCEAFAAPGCSGGACQLERSHERVVSRSRTERRRGREYVRKVTVLRRSNG